MNADFANQTAVITGGTRGIGRAIALDLLERGAQVFALWHANQAAADALQDAGARFGASLCVQRCDVTRPEDVQRFWSEFEQQAPGGAQILVANSGIRRDGVLAMMPLEDWHSVIATNLTGSFLMAKHAVLSMLQRRYGRIVFITSPAAEHGFEGQANYSASKAGQVGLMRSLAREVAKRGITVNCVSPGFVETDMLADLPDKLRQGHQRSVPLQRFARPEEVAYAVRCLVSREASYITGTSLEVAGGL